MGGLGKLGNLRLKTESRMHLVSPMAGMVLWSLKILIGLAALIYQSKCQATALACQRQDVTRPDASNLSPPKTAWKMPNLPTKLLPPTYTPLNNFLCIDIMIILKFRFA